ncbi:MAG TPA: hypothetical protein VHE78_02320 [Gemmatimonadaceae bacterium]|nr:hypothetical protein [Gemmatimonadaceae bacterium]
MAGLTQLYAKLKLEVSPVKSAVAQLRSYLLGGKAYFRLANMPGVFAEMDQWRASGGVGGK